MIKIRRSSPTFYRVFFSYTVLTASIILIIGITSYIFFSSSYNEEIEMNNKHILQYERDSLESNIFNRVREIYIDLSLAQTNKDMLSFFIDHPVEGNHAMLADVLDFLSQRVNMNSNIISSISIYYPNRNIVLSTSFGLKYLDPQNFQAYIDMEWINAAQNSSNQSWQWALIRENPIIDRASDHSITLIGAYPWSYNKTSKDAIISLHIKSDGLDHLLRRLAQSDQQAFIINKDGVIISNTDKNIIGQTINKTKWINTILADSNDSDSLISNINDNKYFISYCSLPSTGWYLVRLSPIENFYRRLQYIQRALFAISLITLILGLALSNIFSLKVYNPLNSLVSKVRQLASDGYMTIDKKSEYTIINGVISNLSIKLSEFKKMLDKNQPIIRYNLVTSLLNANIGNNQELEEYLKLAKLDFVYPQFCAIILALDENAMRHIPLAHQQYIKYRLISELESCTYDNQIVICTILDNNSIGIILNTRQINDSYIKEFINMTYRSMGEYTNVRIIAACGTIVSSALQVSRSYEEAKDLMQYRYFAMPNSILLPRSLLDRNGSKEKLPSDLEEKFSQSLNARNISDCMKYAKQFIRLIHKGNYEAEYCITRLYMFCHVMLDFAYKIKYQPIDGLEDILSQPLKYIWNISELEELLETTMKKLFDFIDRQNSIYNINMIDSLKVYISENLDKILSLDSLADVVHINPKYLSRIFKDITGENITDYINKKRMEKASELLMNTHMTIEEIAIAVGYNNCSYFIRRFKETYTYTPRNYRMMMLKQGKALKTNSSKPL